MIHIRPGLHFLASQFVRSDPTQSVQYMLYTTTTTTTNPPFFSPPVPFPYSTYLPTPVTSSSPFLYYCNPFKSYTAITSTFLLPVHVHVLAVMRLDALPLFGVGGGVDFVGRDAGGGFVFDFLG